MKFLRLVWKNATRNKRRAALTLVSIAIAIVTICVLNTIIYAFNAGVEVADEARLIVRNAVSLINPLPIAYEQRLAKVRGVKSVCHANWFGGVYQNKKNFFAKFAVDAETYFPMYPEFEISDEEWRDFLADRKGCIVGRKLAAKYGFEVGGVIPIEGDIYPLPNNAPWEFNVRGIYEGNRKGVDESSMYFHWKYLDESLPPRRQGNVTFYVIHLSDPSDAARIAAEIDAEFENSAEQTLTETEKAFQLSFVKMMGNVQLLVRIIGAAVVFALLLVAANTMAMAARERTTEIAILKTLGFRNGHLGSLVLIEGTLLTVVGWALGTGIAWFVCGFVENAFSTFFQAFPLKAATVILALAIAVLTGAVSSVFPALHAARTSIVNAMRKVA
jgi:putative ABC transport system permease protein